MTDPDSFLARWLRHRRDAASQESTRSKPKDVRESSPAASDAQLAGDVEPPFDPACVPPLDSIGPGSDIRPFLATGVPAELKRMALRRAWSTDPTIRDFVGLSENAWDFNAVGAAPGFGAIDDETVRQLAKKMVEGSGTDLPMPSSAAARCDQTAQHDDASNPKEDIDAGAGGGAVPVRDQQSHDPGESCIARRNGADVAMQTESGRHESDRLLTQPRHGGAVPK